MVYNYKKQRNPIVPMYTILGSTTDGAPEKNGGDPRAAKQQIRKVEDTPAPNSYSLPNMVGKTTQSNKRQAPCYSLTGRSKVGSFHEDLSKTPGPGTYNTTDPGVFKDKAPHYSFGIRIGSWQYGHFWNWMSYDDYKKPPPGTYSPENVTINKNSFPAYSFGIRHTLPRAPIIVDKPE